MSQPDGAEQSAVPIFEVAFKQGMWWSIPADMSQRMYENYKNNEDLSYTWDWGNSRYGSWAPEGAPEGEPNQQVGAAKPRQRASTISAPRMGSASAEQPASN